MEKLEWLGYPMVKNFEDIFIRFHATHERDRQTHRQTDRQTPHADVGRAYASRGKMVLFTASRRNTFVGGTCALPSALLVLSVSQSLV